VVCPWTRYLRRRANELQLNEWGLGGRNFGTFISWFLMGGDLYTASSIGFVKDALVYVFKQGSS